MTPHRLLCGASHLPARRSRQNATFIYYQALTPESGSLMLGFRIYFLFRRYHLWI